MLEPIVNRVAGLDVHKMVILATILITQEDGETRKETKEFGTFRKSSPVGTMAGSFWN